MKRSKCDGDVAAVFLSEVPAVFDSVFLCVGGLTLRSLNSFSKLCMSPPFTEALRCSYKEQRAHILCDVAAFRSGSHFFCFRTTSQQPATSLVAVNMSHNNHAWFHLWKVWVGVLLMPFRILTLFQTITTINFTTLFRQETILFFHFIFLTKSQHDWIRSAKKLLI